MKIDKAIELKAVLEAENSLKEEELKAKELKAQSGEKPKSKRVANRRKSRPTLFDDESEIKPDNGLEAELEDRLKIKARFDAMALAKTEIDAKIDAKAKAQDIQAPSLSTKDFAGLHPQFVARNIKAGLKEQVIGQESAINAVALELNRHQKRVFMQDLDFLKTGLILTGPTGCGKTHIMRCVAKYLKVPIAVVDSSQITQAGFSGTDTEDMFSSLLVQAASYALNMPESKAREYVKGRRSLTPEIIELAERGIVFLDELDKLCQGTVPTTHHGDYDNGKAVQKNMLARLEGDTIAVPHESRGAAGVDRDGFLTHIKTQNILFIGAGAFVGLDEHVDKCGGDVHKAFVSYGLIPEFLGRMSKHAVLDELDEKALLELTRRVIKQVALRFALDDVEIEFEEELLIDIARKTLKLGLGARGILGLLDDAVAQAELDIERYRGQKLGFGLDGMRLVD